MTSSPLPPPALQAGGRSLREGLDPCGAAAVGEAGLLGAGRLPASRMELLRSRGTYIKVDVAGEDSELGFSIWVQCFDLFIG